MFVAYANIAETNEYAILIAEGETAILQRKLDRHYCYLSESDTDYLVNEVTNINEFTIICNSFQYIDPLQERNVC